MKNNTRKYRSVYVVVDVAERLRDAAFYHRTSQSRLAGDAIEALLATLPPRNTTRARAA